VKFVSALMPTRGRSRLAEKAVQCFLSQNYLAKELLILDDADDPSFPDFFKRTDFNFIDIIYLIESKRQTIGWKRNKLAERARGEILFHWDSDDWSDVNRMATQVEFLEDSGKSVTGFSSMLFVDEHRKIAWRYRAPNRVVGSSLCYTRAFWQSHPFPNEQIEESEFMNAAIAAGEFVRADGFDLMVARLHADNTVIKKPSNSPETYRPVPWEDISNSFF
jgi:glycosyltransferase involved in cell wall biosynthesis